VIPLNFLYRWSISVHWWACTNAFCVSAWR